MSNENNDLAYKHLGLIASSQLKLGSDRPRLAPAAMDLVLEACCDIEFPDLQSWFAEELSLILVHDQLGKEDRHWGDLLERDIVRAASKQIPAHVKPEYASLWQETLRHPRFCSAAVNALSQTPTDRLRYLGEWWNAEPAPNTGQLRAWIKQAIKYTETGELQLTHQLLHEGARWPFDLRMAVNKIMEEEGQQLPFPPAAALP